MYLGLLNLQNLRHIATYLEHYWEFEAHILQFWSTIQYYKTAEYDRHRTIGDGDIPHSFFFALVINTCVCIMDVWHGFGEILMIRNTMWSISITNGPMPLIFYSFIVLDSTSKLQNMSFKLPVVFEIGDDMPQIFRISLSQTDTIWNNFFWFCSESWTSDELISMIKRRIPFEIFLVSELMLLLVGKNYKNLQTLLWKKL